MLTLIEALNYRSLRYVSQPLRPFQVLVGPNGSGKTTFLDVVSFLGRLVTDGPEAAIIERSALFSDLLWQHQGNRFELAVEARLPNSVLSVLGSNEWQFIRYEVAIGTDSDKHELGISNERVLLLKGQTHEPAQRTLFPAPGAAPETILSAAGHRSRKTVVNKVTGGNDNFRPETGKGYAPSFKLGRRKSALASIPADEVHFPASIWLKQLLQDGVRQIVLNSLLMRKASPPNLPGGYRPDGSNLPWVVDELGREAPGNRWDWVGHLRTALPDLRDITTVERDDDRHKYFQLHYANGLTIPSWLVSDGTLRLLALTVPAYLRDFTGIYLIEEPENGIHPRAIEAVMQSLSSVYEAQVLLATHSPVILSVTAAEDILCFAKDDEGATDIVTGSNHPRLSEWKGATNLGVLFAAGVLG